MKSIAQFRRDIVGKTLVCTYHFRDYKVGVPRKIIKIQTASIKTEVDGKNLWVDIPNKKNFEYADDTVRFYNTAGIRDLAKEERAEYDRIKKESKEYGEKDNGNGDTRFEMDMMTDTNLCFYYEKGLWQKSIFPKLKSKIVGHGKDVCVYDDNVKGKLEIEYKIV